MLTPAMVLPTLPRLLRVTIATAVLLAASPAAAQVVLDAKPTVKVESGPKGTSRFVLGEPEQTERRVTIVKRGDRYYWTSRDNRELVHVRSGAFHYFIRPGGTGYVKVFDTHYLPESLREPGPRFHYLEHLSQWLDTITYWGTRDEFRLDGTRKP